jgi:hypothetical protein
LAISPATDDIANSVAIKNAKKVDREGNRTIGNYLVILKRFSLDLVCHTLAFCDSELL